MTEKILMVDDEVGVVSAFKRTLSRDFSIDIASSARQALEILQTSGPYAVVVSDLSMPEMTGIELLARVKQSWPDTVRILLTGHVDTESAVKAINQGHIYSFLTKPCPKEDLVTALHGALAQYRLGISERDVLEQSLMGALTVLIEVLSMIHPAAFGRVATVRRYACRLATELKLPDIWRIEAAALLSQIGLVSVPTETVEKHYVGSLLTNEERLSLEAHPHVGYKLLQAIPRLSLIAIMIERQKIPFYIAEKDSNAEPGLRVASQILHAALDFDELTTAGLNPSAAVAKMRDREGEYDPRLLDILACVAEGDPSLPGEDAACRGTPKTSESEVPLAWMSTQVWEAVNEHAKETSASARSITTESLASAPSTHSMVTETLSDVLSALNDSFDALYTQLPDWEDRMLLRESYVLARDAFCDTAGRTFAANQAATDALIVEIRRILGALSQPPTDIAPQQRLRSLVNAVNLATQLVVLADRVLDPQEMSTSIQSLPN